MARGRKPDTPDQQAEKGAPGKRMSQKEAAARRVGATKILPVSVGSIRPPKWLKRSRKATEIWNDLAPRLARMNIISDLDSEPLGRYCRYIVEWIAADISVQKEGTWYEATGTNGEQLKKRHPAWQACQDIEKMLRETEAAFGMRPDARFKIMRDQAAAHGALPLFAEDRPQQQDDGTAAQSAPAEDETQLGILNAFDSAPPGRPN